MALQHSAAVLRARKILSIVGIAAFFASVHWLWRLRDLWPRSSSDSVPHVILEAIGVLIAGLYLYSKGV